MKGNFCRPRRREAWTKRHTVGICTPTGQVQRNRARDRKGFPGPLLILPFVFSWAIPPIFPASDDDFRTCCFSLLLPVQLQIHLSTRLQLLQRHSRVTSKHCWPTAKLMVSTSPLTSNQPVPPECLSLVQSYGSRVTLDFTSSLDVYLSFSTVPALGQAFFTSSLDLSLANVTVSKGSLTFIQKSPS